MSFCLILLAAGNSARFNSNLAKPYHKIGGKTLLEISLSKASRFRQIKKVIVVHNKRDRKNIKKLNTKNVKFIVGGKTRQQSTLIALKYLSKYKLVSKVLIHDAARPNFSPELLKSIIKYMTKFRAAIPVIKIRDAVKQKNGKFIISKDRNDLFLTQTPQGFRFKEIYNLHKSFKNRYHDDDFSLLRNFN